jgi:2-succinyl-6-hydroxy-2,4-cyclohexadiene-1-carboxylate synthase
VPPPPVVLAHGFTQTARAWGPFADLLGRHLSVTTVDLPGHAGTPPPDDLPHAAHLLGRAGGWGAYVGYSLGGRVALHLALAQPELVTALVLLGAHPGIEDPAERDERRRADDALADRLEAIGVSAFLDEWLAQPLFASLATDAGQRAAREANTADGLAATLRALSTGRQAPLWDRLPRLAMPVLVLAGERDEKYVRIGRQAAAAIGDNAVFVTVEGAGHAAHLEQPERTAATVTAFLSASPEAG